MLQVLEQQATITANGFHPEVSNLCSMATSHFMRLQVDMQDPHVDPRLAAPQPLAAQIQVRFVL